MWEKGGHFKRMVVLMYTLMSRLRKNKIFRLKISFYGFYELREMRLYTLYHSN